MLRKLGKEGSSLTLKKIKKPHQNTKRKNPNPSNQQQPIPYLLMKTLGLFTFKSIKRQYVFISTNNTGLRVAASIRRD